MFGHTALSQLAAASRCLKAAVTGPVTTGSTPSGASAKTCSAGALDGKAGRASFSVAAVSLCGGVALYLVALSAFKRRNYGSYNYPRLVAAAVLVALTPLAGTLDAVLALALVAAVTAVLIAYETLRYAAARDRIRHA